MTKVKAVVEWIFDIEDFECADEEIPELIFKSIEDENITFENEVFGRIKYYEVMECDNE